ncbi:radical SAM protein [Paucidesulfovibrio longus]|uniref:radical SAM protein n=1 Tax=Paucidesulfovibrio longus TaxID=889 RepID=UPI0003B31EB3|nr:radical SAM protein [Paucidesulfovibrio longus]
MAFTYIFGPVMSGRLGLSLGLDLLREKICSMDCAYCEVGPTSALTLERRAWVPARDILDELAQWAAQGRDTEYVTLGGSGEPTLNTEFGEVIRGVREILPGKPVAVLTNSTLLHVPDVRRDLCLADVVLPSLDTLVPQEMRRLNRCIPGLGPETIVRGLLDFRKEFSGAVFLEILLARGFNDSEENLRLLSEFIPRLDPDRVDVVTLTRPGTLDSARAVDAPTLARWRAALGAHERRNLRAEARERDLPDQEAREALRSSLARRPQTVLQLAGGLGLGPERVRRLLDALVAEDELDAREVEDGLFYSLRRSGR